MLEEEVENIFNLVDTNHNGVIDYSEFIAASSNISQYKSDKQLKGAFKAFDLDNSGGISFLEFEEIFQLGADLSKSELLAIFEEFDQSRDGQINFEEFKLMVKKVFFKYNKAASMTK